MDKITSFYQLLEENAKSHPDKTAVLYDTFAASYRDLFKDACHKAIHLQRFPGKRIAIYGPASYRWIVNMLGIILAGKDAVLVDFFLPQDMRKRLLKKIGIDYILSSTNQYILADEEAIIIANADKDEVEGLTYQKRTAEGNILMFTATPDESDKAVVLTPANLLNTVNAISSHCPCDENDKVLSQIPLHHIFGLAYSLLWPLTCGACVCVGRGLRHIDADTYYYHPTILPGTPSMMEYLKKLKAFNKELKRVLIGGASCPFRLFEYLRDQDLCVYSVYGMTESSGCIAVNRDMDGSYEIYAGTNVELAHDGEILVSGPCVMEGYDKDDKTSSDILKDGVLHTGDYGRFNRHGRLVLVKRNPGILLLPTGEKISRKVTNQEITDLDGIAESYLTVHNDKLTAVIVPIEKSGNPDKFKRQIDRYNKRVGYRWEIQRVVVTDKPLPRISEDEVDEDAIEAILAE